MENSNTIIKKEVVDSVLAFEPKKELCSSEDEMILEADITYNGIFEESEYILSDCPIYNHKQTTAKITLEELEKVCCYAKQQKLFHIKSGETRGVHVEFNLKNIPTEIELDHFVEFKLKRTDPSYNHLPVDLVCEKHKHGLVQFPIEGKVCLLHNRDTNLVKIEECNENMKITIKKEAIKNQEINICMRILFACNDSCMSSSTTFKTKERARDMAIFAKVGVIYFTGKTEFTHYLPPVPVWIKAALNKRDLEKDVRRNPKGFLAMYKKEEKTKHAAKNLITKAQLRREIIPKANRKRSAELIANYVQQEEPNIEVLIKLRNILEKYCAH